MRTDTFIYILAFLGCLICFAPPILGFQLHRKYANIEDIPLISVLNLPSFQLCIAGCTGAIITLVMDLATDSLVVPTRYLHVAKTSVWLILASSICINTFIFTYIIPTSKVEYWACVICCKQFLIYLGGFSMLNAYGPTIWTWKHIFPLILLSLAVNTLRGFRPFMNVHALESAEIFDKVGTCLVLIFFLILCMLWTRYLLSKRRNSISLTMDDIYCTLNLSIFTFAGVMQFLFVKVEGDAMSLEADIRVLLRYFYSFTIFGAIASIVNSRYIRSKMALFHAEREAETKRMLTGFFSHELRTPLNSVMMGLQVLQRDISMYIDTDHISSSTDENHFRYPHHHHPIRLLVEELSCSCESAVDVLNDLLLYQSLDNNNEEENQVLSTTNLIPAICFLRKKLHNSTAQDRLFKGRSKDDVRLIINLPEEGLFIEGKKVEDACIEGDEEKIGRVVRTLVSNAIESTPVGGGTVTVNVTVTSNKALFSRRHSHIFSHGHCHGHGHGHSLRMEVKDEGPALSSVDRERMFDSALSFTAGPLSTREGQGLGLWIANKITKLHHGQLSVHSSNEGQPGRIFTLEIPLIFPTPLSSSLSVHCHEGDQSSFKEGNNDMASSSDDMTTVIHRVDTNSFRSGETVRLNGTGGGGDGGSGGGANGGGAASGGGGDDDECMALDDTHFIITDGIVLVVDDDPVNRKMLSRLLVGHCDSTVLAEDGVVAVQKMRQAMADGSPFDLVLMDYQMPNMDGPTAAKNMRDMGYKGPIIGVTGNTLPFHIETFISQGATAVLHKPLQLARLVRVMKNNSKSNTNTKRLSASFAQIHI